MDHKNPVSGSGDGVLYLDIMKKPAKCTGCKYWQDTLTRGWIFKLQQYHRTGGQMQAVLNPKAEHPV
jgi:hypothetical protein